MDARPSTWTIALVLSCAVSVLAACGLAHPTNPHARTEFAQNFIDLNRRIDDSARTVAYDPQTRILAVGRESGRLELWNTRKTDSRITREAHTVRIEHIAIGSEDGIVLTRSIGTTMMDLDPQAMPKVWDARSGELLVALPGEWFPGPVVASPVKGYYLIASGEELRVYDHARRAIVGDALTFKGEITALGSDRKSGLVAVGTGRGELGLVRLNLAGETPGLEMVSSTSTYGLEPGTDVLAVMLLDYGRRLITVNWLPEKIRKKQPPAIAGQNTEIVRWDTRTWQRERTYPMSLQTVHWASYTPGESWLVLAGNESTRGKIELIDLEGGVAWRYKANTTHPVAVLLPEVRTGLILQSGSATKIRYLAQ